ncbi:MAG: hypothetical protein ABS76_10030 [Pelagibacterium sp. SCN 64-44]|nr:MAG: hypothetical protein ABS76_10030 [Pelagibacterium sp. SCN 64-44]
MSLLHPLPSVQTLLLIALSNALPLLGVLVAGWDIYTLLVFYWCETLLVGFWTVLTIALHEGEETWSFSGPTKNTSPTAGWGAAFITVHAGFFMAIHLFLMSVLFGGDWPGHLRSASVFIDTFVIGQGLWPMLVVVCLQRAALFWQERNEPSVMPAIAGLYLRIIVMQVVIITGAWGAMLAGSGLFGLILLVGLRTLLDVFWPRLIGYAVDNMMNRKS